MYNKNYTAEITVTPDSNHTFSEATIAEDFVTVLNEDGTLTLKKYFTTAKAKITSLTPPEKMKLTDYYNNADDIITLLPTVISIEAEDGTSELPISWTPDDELDTASGAVNTFAWTADIGELDADSFETSGTITVTNTGYVIINEENFPDEIFRSYVSDILDNGDGKLTDSEIAAVTYIDVPEMGISDLTGVEYFTALTVLYCYNNQLTSLDVSNNTELTDLYCYNNQLESLDVSNNTALETLYCSNNRYDIYLIGGKFDLSAMPEGFDITKASDWNNATVEGDMLVFDNPTVEASYSYDLGNGSTETFYLYPVSNTIETTTTTTSNTTTSTNTTTSDDVSDTTTSTTTVPVTTTVVKGDADNDGDVDMNDANKVIDSVNGAIDQFGSTAEEHEAIAGAVDIDGDGAITKTDAALILGFTAGNTSFEESASLIVPAADIDMTDLNAKLAEAEAITNDNTYTEESYAALQEAIEAVKATQNAENLPSDYAEQMSKLLANAIDGLEENLPQTGYSVIYNYIMLAASAMVLFGIFAMAKSRKRDEE